MGADFMCTSLPACQLTIERKNSLLELVENTKQEDMEGWAVDAYDEVEDFKVALRCALDEYEVAPNSHEVGDWQPEGSPYNVFFTGGMSYGDAPTEAFDGFIDLDNHGLIYNKLREFAIEDIENEGTEEH